MKQERFSLGQNTFHVDNVASVYNQLQISVLFQRNRLLQRGDRKISLPERHILLAQEKLVNQKRPEESGQRQKISAGYNFNGQPILHNHSIENRLPTENQSNTLNRKMSGSHIFTQTPSIVVHAVDDGISTSLTNLNGSWNGAGNILTIPKYKFSSSSTGYHTDSSFHSDDEDQV